MDLPDDLLEVLLHRAHTGQYINSVAHDLNNLIGAAMAYAELVEMDSTDPEVKRMVGEIISASEKSAELLNAITAIARPLRIDKEANCGVQEAFDAMDLLYAYNCKLSQIALTFTTASNIQRIGMEQHVAQRILMRLIDNAMESVRECESKKVNVTAERADDKVRIVVSDSGPGVSADSGDSIFVARFTTKPNHLGMGLTTARELAERCGATLTHEASTGFVLTARHVSN